MKAFILSDASILVRFSFFMLLLMMMMTLLQIFSSGSSINGRNMFSHRMFMSTAGTAKASILPYIIHLKGPVANGYGRGSKTLGFPTANLPYFNDSLTESNLSNGVYCGWGKVSNSNSIYKCISNIGISPTFAGEENKVRIVESFLLDPSKSLPEDFYGQSLQVSLCYFLRPEHKFSNIQDLIAQIKSDVSNAENILNDQTDESKDSKIQLQAIKLLEEVNDSSIMFKLVK